MRRTVLLFVLSVLVTFSLIAGGKTEEDVKESAKGPTVISGFGCAGWAEDIFKIVQPKLDSEGITVKGEFAEWPTYDDKQKLMLSSGSVDYDFVFLPGVYIPVWANSGEIIPIDSIVNETFQKNDLYNSVINAITIDGKIYSSPISAEGMILFYRSDIFEKEGLKPPKTIDEMYETAKKLTNDGIYGIAYPGGPGEGACSFWSYFLWSYGGTYFDKNWRPQLNTPEAIKSAEMFAKILRECAPAGVTTWQNEETVAAFSSGNVAMIIMWPGFVHQITDETQSSVAKNVALAPVPVGPTGKAVPRFGAWGISVTKKGRANLDAIGKFLAAYCSKDMLSEIAAKYSWSPLRSINSNPEFIKTNQTLAASAGVENAQERPGIPESSQYIEAVGAAINAVVAGEPAQKTMDELQKKVTSIMQEAGYYD